MNSVNIIGRMVVDAELKKTSSGKSVCSFRVAVDAGKDREAYFFTCNAWNGTAENIAKYFKKGDKIGISGQLTSRSYEQDGRKVTVIEILVGSFDFCNGKRAEQGGGTSSNEQPPETPVVIQTEAAAAGLPFDVSAATGLPFEV